MGEMLKPALAPARNATMVWLLAAATYFLLAASTIHLTSNGRTIAAVWPANAALLALLLLEPRTRWPAVLSAGFVANVAANWVTRGSVAGPFLYGIANGVEIVLAAALLRHAGLSSDELRSARKLTLFLGVTGVVAPTVSGLLGAFTAHAIFAQPFGTAFWTWMLSDGLGLIIFTPVFSAIFSGQLVECFAKKSWAKRAETFVLLLGVAGTTYVVFYVATLPALFLLFAPVMLTTFRVGPLGTKMAVMAIAVIGALATTYGHGPVAAIATDAAGQAHWFQVLLAVVLLTCLPVAAELAERDSLASELARREQAARTEADIDPLTTLLNRRGFALQMARFDRGTDRTCCIVIDVDRFKDINDRWGHPFGDTVLRRLAAVIRSHIRAGDIAVRLGGDEILMLCAVDDLSTGEEICARIGAALRQSPVSPDGRVQIMVGISCGVALGSRTTSLEQLIARADEALYDAKRSGRNCFKTASS